MVCSSADEFTANAGQLDVEGVPRLVHGVPTHLKAIVVFSRASSAPGHEI